MLDHFEPTKGLGWVSALFLTFQVITVGSCDRYSLLPIRPANLSASSSVVLRSSGGGADVVIVDQPMLDDV